MSKTLEFPGNRADSRPRGAAPGFLRTSAKVAISEIFGPVINGEGIIRGEKCIFVRVAGCDGADGTPGSACVWCDSSYAVDAKQFKQEWQLLTQDELAAEILAKSNGCRSVTITGGNPALYDLSQLVEALAAHGYRILVETQGTVYKPWLARCAVVTVSPKPPSSGHPLPDAKLQAFVRAFLHDKGSSSASKEPVLALKPIVDPDSEADYAYGCRIARHYQFVCPVYLSCYTNPNDTRNSLLARYGRLQERVCADPTLSQVWVGFQEHVAIFGHKRGI